MASVSGFKGFKFHYYDLGDNNMYNKSRSTLLQERLRSENIEKLGGRCSNPDCRWHNEDGTIGCSDKRSLEFDYKDEDGAKEWLAIRPGLKGLYYIKNNPERFHLLCANCNQIKSRPL